MLFPPDNQPINQSTHPKSKIQNPHPPRRSLLFMPGDDLRKIAKAANLPADSLVMDLEDGVALSRKEAARQVVLDALLDLDFGHRERLVRINPATSPLASADLRATVAGRPDGYVLPKVESAQDVLAVARFLDEVEQVNGWPLGSIRLLAIVETALGVLNLREIAQSCGRLDALAFGGEDLAGDTGAIRTRAGWEILYARSAVVMAAAAYGLQALDTIFVDLADVAGLAEECAFARGLGFVGKMAIHPRQVEVINRAFSPTQEEVAAAQRLIDAADAHQTGDVGVFELDGKMVDMPMVRAARRVLERAGSIHDSFNT